ncbi:MAG TPA: hypothetical protein VEH05_16230 [Streptosporangiaceae bacterium]|nr:hypothetical protein [Streptosporangiaceae bacterium]
MAWLWISAPIAAVFFLGYTVIPLWLVFRRPDVGPAESDRPAAGPADAARPVAGPGRPATPSVRPARALRPAPPGQRLETARR